MDSTNQSLSMKAQKLFLHIALIKYWLFFLSGILALQFDTSSSIAQIKESTLGYPIAMSLEYMFAMSILMLIFVSILLITTDSNNRSVVFLLNCFASIVVLIYLGMLIAIRITCNKALNEIMAMYILNGRRYYYEQPPEVYFYSPVYKMITALAVVDFVLHFLALPLGWINYSKIN